MITQTTGGDLVKMKLSEQHISTSKLETTQVQGTKQLHEIAGSYEVEQQKVAPVKKTSKLPAPFYDELHFANYE
jgi:hypothetical protein